MRKQERHTTTGRWKLGFGLAFLTMCAWATLPAALSASLHHMDAYTLTWFRFMVATVIMGAWSGSRARGPIRFPAKGLGMLLVAAVMLTADYLLYLIGLDLTTPAVAQVHIQAALVLVAMGGICLFGERFSRAQWAGFIALIGGLAVFFHRQLAAFSTESDRLWLGGLLVLGAGAAWAVYALVQKQLLVRFSSGHIMLFIYAFATVALLPLADPASLGAIEPIGWVVVGYSALNTLVAYGAFAEALNHWEASRVSALLALTPLGTILLGMLLERTSPGILPLERLDGFSLAGAALVVVGSLVASLAGDRSLQPPMPSAER
jgi:drug/metabolite transporter (DMT)-like permease